MLPADPAARAGSTPEASGDSSSGTLARNMAALIYVAQSIAESPQAGDKTVLLDDSAVYWFLYRYFQSASLPSTDGELVDLYNSTEIYGYQLERFVDELRIAEGDVMAKPAEWSVLLGWHGDVLKKETERRETLNRNDVLEVIRALLILAHEAQNSGSKLISSGD